MNERAPGGRKYLKVRRPNRTTVPSSNRSVHNRRRSKSDTEKYKKKKFDETRVFISPYVGKRYDESKVRTYFEKKRKEGFVEQKTPPYERSIDMLHRYREYREYYSDQQPLTKKLEQYKNPQRTWLISNSPRRHEPNIFQKPNAVEKLEKSMKMSQLISEEIEDMDHIKTGHNGLGGPVLSNSSPHPYASEIQKFEYSNDQLDVDRVVDLFELNKCFEHRSIEYVDKRERLKEIVEQLNEQREFAVSCQQHTYRSFQGFICLVQISTYHKDYVIDAIKLRKDIHLLNRPFTNPEIVKVIYNADHKLLWLQRDFSMYMINTFDIMVASQILYETQEKTTLSFLLNRFYSVEIGPDLEAFDWRFRPIPSEMVFYLMSTTYFLVLLYHQLKRDLMDKYKSFKVISRVFDIGRIQCSRRYEKVMKAEESFLARKFLELDFTEPQKLIYKSLFELRDELSRKNDESWRYYIDDDELEFLCEHVIDEVEDPNFGDVIYFFSKSDRIPVLLERQLPQVIDIIREHHPKSFKNIKKRKNKKKKKKLSNNSNIINIINNNNDNKKEEEEKGEKEEDQEEEQQQQQQKEEDQEEEDQKEEDQEEEEKKKEEIEKDNNIEEEKDGENEESEEEEDDDEEEEEEEGEEGENNNNFNSLQIRESPHIPPVKLKRKFYHTNEEGSYPIISAREVFERINWSDKEILRNPYFMHSQRKTLSFDAVENRTTGARRKSFFSGMLRENGGGGSSNSGGGSSSSSSSPGGNSSPSEEIPSSLTQIYELSQISRRKNSQKKKKKKKAMIENWKKMNNQKSSKSSGGEESGEDNNDNDEEKEEEKKKQQIPLQPLQEFLVDIGWN